MTYGDFQDLAKRTASDKVLKEKAFDIAKNPKYDGYQRALASMVYKVFDKKNPKLVVLKMKLNKMNKLAEELHKPIIKKEKYTHPLKTIFGVLILHIRD